MQEHGLGLVVAVVGREDAVQAAPALLLPEEGVAQVPGGFLQPAAARARPGGNVYMRNRQRHAEPGAERLDKGAVPLGVLPPHAVLDVRGDDLRPQRQQEMQQHHGVHAARERHQGAAPLQAFRNVFPHRLALLWNQSVSNFIWTAKIFQALNQIVWFF